ncbi:Bestrophin, RFP-TM, chloride channel-domain-containing protein [Hysterangium stoloniferum]|nr:Bestrophin, RFP-TM, chloride channel-domain-containing protein [Hysterangium stoloniferum]
MSSALSTVSSAFEFLEAFRGVAEESSQGITQSTVPVRGLTGKISQYSWLPDVMRIRGSILTRIIGPVLTVTLFATLIATVYDQGYDVTLSNSVTPLLAVVVGLILVFRNTTSYDRYYEGRKDFGSMMSTIRNLSRLIWVNVNISPTSTLTASALKAQKVQALRLLLSYAFAVKHHLRGEEGTEWDDYRGVLPPGFSSYNPGYDTISRNGGYSSSSSIGGAGGLLVQGGSITPTEYSPLLTDSHQTVECHPYADKLSLPLPMVIAHEVTRMLHRFKRLGYLEVIGPAGTSAMMQLCGSLSDQLTAMERIANTPIPSFYGVHLKQCVTLYLCALPSTLVKELGWKMIPIVTVVAITLMGIEGIADEIEMPFGHDQCDLPLGTPVAVLPATIPAAV